MTDDKETRILDAAAELFASRPFHRVLLSDVAAAARVGKGTLYLYFNGKDDLYLAVLFREFSALVERLHAHMDEDAPAREQMAAAVRELALHMFGKAHIMELMRGAVVDCPRTNEWQDKRRELRGVFEAIIRRGIGQGVFEDPDPRLTAQYVPGLMRSACLFQPEGTDAADMVAHATAFVLRGLEART